MTFINYQHQSAAHLINKSLCTQRYFQTDFFLFTLKWVKLTDALIKVQDQKGLAAIELMELHWYLIIIMRKGIIAYIWGLRALRIQFNLNISYLFLWTALVRFISKISYKTKNSRTPKPDPRTHIKISIQYW